MTGIQAQPLQPMFQGHDLTGLREGLVRAVSKVCPPSLSDRADDLVQAGLMRVMDLADHGDREFNRSYLWRVAYTAVVDEIRKLKKRGEVSMTQEEGGDLDPAGEHPDPETTLHGKQVGRAIRDCLSNLLDARRRAVTLHLQGHNVPETAELLGFAAKKAENLVYRGLKELRACLSTKGVTP